jgi:hypothetical protein
MYSSNVKNLPVKACDHKIEKYNIDILVVNIILYCVIICIDCICLLTRPIRHSIVYLNSFVIVLYFHF